MFTLILIGFLTFLVYFYYKHKHSYWSKRGVPGPKAYPILGTLWEESKLPADETDFKFYKEFGATFGTYYNTQPVFNTSDPELIKQVLNDLHTFPNISSIQFNDNFLAKSIFFKSDADWKHGRAAQTHYFTSKNLRNLMVHLEKTTANFIENLDSERRANGSDVVDAKKILKYFSIDGISKVLFAIDIDSYKERDTLFVKSVATLGQLNPKSQALCTILPKQIAEFFRLQPFNLHPVNSLGKYFERMIDERKKTCLKYNDLLEALQNAVDNNKVKMTKDEVIGNCLLSYFAGVEAVSNALTKMIYFLSENRDVQQKLYDEVKKNFSDEITYEKIMQNEYLDAVFNETIRLGANFLLMSRYASVDTMVGKYLIERGTEIRLLTNLSHNTRDWNDAFSFNPNRFLKDSEARQDNFFIPFGLGPKLCLGMRLALLEVKFLIVNLLKKYEFVKPQNSGYSANSFRGFMNVISLNIVFKERAK